MKISLDWYTGASSYDITLKAGLEEGLKNAEIKYDSGRDVVILKHSKSGKYLFVEEDGSVRICADKDTASKFEQYDWGWGYVNYKCIANGKMLQEDNGVLKATAKDAYMWFVRPVKKLCGFSRKEIPAGGTVDVVIDIDPHYLEVYEKDSFVLETGMYIFATGGDCESSGLKADINL